MTDRYDQKTHGGMPGKDMREGHTGGWTYNATDTESITKIFEIDEYANSMLSCSVSYDHNPLCQQHDCWRLTLTKPL